MLGAGGAVGSVLANSLALSGEVIGVDRERGAEVTLQCDVSEPAQALLDALADADVAVLALPERVIAAVAGDIAAALRPGALLVDTSSVKNPVLPALQAAGADLEVLTINPLFRPALGFQGQRVAAVVVAPGELGEWFLDELRSWGATVRLIDAMTHDRRMALAQALVHALVLTFGSVLSAEDEAIDDVLELGPPPLQTFAALLARMTDGPSEPYWAIQADNPYAGDARREALAALERLDMMIRHGTPGAMDDLLSTLFDSLGPSREVLSERCGELFELLAEASKPEPGSPPE